jgi:lipid A ethanolaminephosphotransferase
MNVAPAERPVRDEPTTRWFRVRPTLATETLVLLSSTVFAVAFNAPFFRGVMAGRSMAESQTWTFAAAMVALLIGLHVLMLSLVANRWIVKPLLSVLFVVTAIAAYYMQKFGVFLDPSMVRNVLSTDPAEAGELLGWSLATHLLFYAALPIALLWRVNVAARSLRRAVIVRFACLLGALAVIVVAVLAVFQDFSSLMRNQKELRYLITPANYLYSTASVMISNGRRVNVARDPVGTDATLGPDWKERTRPVLFVIVVGETARSASWGLNGYKRQTTPELSQIGLLNFRDVSACGTSTEVSLPCMFSAVGRRDYDEQRIRHSESLLHVLNRTGLTTLWHDNQSGCKGVCDGLPADKPDAERHPELCANGRCLDEVLLKDLEARIDPSAPGQVLVLHMLGNHGPEYFRRHPPEFRRFTPTCDTGELRKCTTEEITNSYDNALLYTDRVLARTISFLAGKQATHDTAMIYVSDHGESLGESGLYLHGIPYAIAPSEQLKVPMVWWLSPAFLKNFDLDDTCLRGKSVKAWSHDNLFHSVLGLLQVNTEAYRPELDISSTCRHRQPPMEARN